LSMGLWVYHKWHNVYIRKHEIPTCHIGGEGADYGFISVEGPPAISCAEKRYGKLQAVDKKSQVIICDMAWRYPDSFVVPPSEESSVNY